MNGPDMELRGLPGEANDVTVARDAKVFTVSDYRVAVGDGNDRFTLGIAGLGEVDGGRGNDRLRGGPDGDRLRGGDGNDVISAGAGADDVLDGGRVADTIGGGDGDDQVSGGSGRDVLRGDRGNDRIAAGSGKTSDSLSGGPGSDELIGSAGPNRIDGGPGEDTLSGVDGRDELRARDGVAEKIFCGRGRDRLIIDAADFISSACELQRRPRFGAATVLDPTYSLIEGDIVSDVLPPAIGCSGDGPVRCSGTITFRRGRTVLLRGSFIVRRGRIGRAGKLQRTAAARRLPLDKRVATTVTLVTRDRNGRTVFKRTGGMITNRPASVFE